MLYTILVILLLMWLVGMIGGYTVGGLLHLLLLFAVVILIVRLLQGRSVV